MPTYSFRHETTGEEKDLYLSLSDREKFLKENPEWKQIHKGTPKIVSHTGSILSKTSQTYRDRLKQIKKNAGRFNRIHD